MPISCREIQGATDRAIITPASPPRKRKSAPERSGASECPYDLRFMALRGKPCVPNTSPPPLICWLGLGRPRSARLMRQYGSGVICSCGLVVDEMHGFVFVRQKNLGPMRHEDLTMGEQYLFIAMDSETKLVPSFLVGKRSATNTYYLMRDLESRLVTRPQITTDGFRPYVNAVDDTFETNVDYAMLIKMYAGDESTRERYSPSEIVETRTVQSWAIRNRSSFPRHTWNVKISPCECSFADLLV